MRLMALVFFLLSFFAPVSAVNAAGTVLVKREAVSLPSYDEALETTDVALYADMPRYTLAANDPKFVLEKLIYRSGDLEVAAFVMREKNGEARPAVIFNRGSYVRNNAAPELLPLLYAMARRGFTVVAPMYRGSEGAGGRDEMGGDDLADLMIVAQLVKELPSADPEKLYLYGESRGGMMVYQAVRDGFPARAAAVYGAFTDLGAMIEGDPERYGQMTSFLWPDFEDRKTEILSRRSALSFADDIKIPMLIMHGGRDGDVPLSQSLDMAAALAARDAEFDLVVFGDDTHILPGHQNERDALAASWFRNH